jgi:hypothetical protein
VIRNVKFRLEVFLLQGFFLPVLHTSPIYKLHRLPLVFSRIVKVKLCIYSSELSRPGSALDLKNEKTNEATKQAPSVGSFITKKTHQTSSTPSKEAGSASEIPIAFYPDMLRIALEAEPRGGRKTVTKEVKSCRAFTSCNKLVQVGDQ